MSALPNLESGSSLDLASFRGDGRRLLLAEDNAALRRTLARVLGMLRFEVTAVPGPAEALEAFRREPKAFAAVITDLNLPGLTGIELGMCLRELNPEVPLILSSGALPPEAEAKAREVGFASFLWKPCTFETLASALHQALHA